MEMEYFLQQSSSSYEEKDPSSLKLKISLRNPALQDTLDSVTTNIDTKPIDLYHDKKNEKEENLLASTEQIEGEEEEQQEEEHQPLKLKITLPNFKNYLKKNENDDNSSSTEGIKLRKSKRKRRKPKELDNYVGSYIDLSKHGNNLLEGSPLQFHPMSVLKRPYYDGWKIVKRFKTGMEVSFEEEFLQNGFRTPFVVLKMKGLGLKVPSDEHFSVDDVASKVGKLREFEVIDVIKQSEQRWSMKKWAQYYNTPQQKRRRIFNVISLEFSDSPLTHDVHSPRFVRETDWIDNVWPVSLKEDTLKEYTEVNSEKLSEQVVITHKYPKVQKYCLMSVAGSYTDFHIDFGGSSVWYHIVKGRKIFFLIAPTEENLQKYTEWSSSPSQSDIFFGDTVDHLFRIELMQGNTFFIPSGWIHAVFTPDDSIVFGGNFLHGFDIKMQLRVQQVEEDTGVGAKYQFPFFSKMLWYAARHYSDRITQYHNELDGEKREEGEKIVTRWEWDGLWYLVTHLGSNVSSTILLPEQEGDYTSITEQNTFLKHFTKQLQQIKGKIFNKKDDNNKEKEEKEEEKKKKKKKKKKRVVITYDYSKDLYNRPLNELKPVENIVIKLYNVKSEVNDKNSKSTNTINDEYFKYNDDDEEEEEEEYQLDVNDEEYIDKSVKRRKKQRTSTKTTTSITSTTITSSSNKNENNNNKKKLSAINKKKVSSSTSSTSKPSIRRTIKRKTSARSRLASKISKMGGR